MVLMTNLPEPNVNCVSTFTTSQMVKIRSKVVLSGADKMISDVAEKTLQMCK